MAVLPSLLLLQKFPLPLTETLDVLNINTR